MLPALPGDPRDHDRLVVANPRREVVEIRTATNRVLHILEPVTVGLEPHRLREHTDVAQADPTDGQALVYSADTGLWTPGTVAAAQPPATGGLRGFVESDPITVPVTGAGVTGNWVATPDPWHVTIGAEVGNVLEFSPLLVLGGGPAALDVASMAGNAPVRFRSSGSFAPAALGSIYVQGDYGAVHLPTLRWRVGAQDIVAGAVRLALMYRESTGDTMSLGHADAVGRMSVTNLGTPQ